jgi:hypothetical protein
VKLYNRVKNPFFLLVSFGVFSIFGGGIFIVYHFNQLEDQNQNEIFADINQTFRLQLNHDGGGDVFGDGYYEAGTEARIWAIPNIGYSFKRWVGEDDFILEELNTTVPIFSDINLTAIFVQNEFQLKTGRNISKSMGIRDFEAFETSKYFDESGKKMMTLKFASADVERPKIGFLRTGLAFLVVRDLEMLLYLDDLSADFLSVKINELKEQKGVSYAVAEPATFFFLKNDEVLKINANKGKLTNNGTFRLWGGVLINNDQDIYKTEKLEISISSKIKNLLLTDLEIDTVIKEIPLD